MNLESYRNERGIAYTFYSFKGGVGRSMALANVGALLAKWGRRVLLLDWDLEAPGLERFFSKHVPTILTERGEKPGIVDLILAHADENALDWRDTILNVRVGGNGSALSLISAGRSTKDYSQRLQSIDFDKMFAEHDLGGYLEELRDQWLNEYEFVLIDSRTGVTDIGGICTVQLADVLVLLLTTTETSLEGTKSIIERARERQQVLPVDRQRLLAIPVPSRDESRTEYERAAEWKERFANEFKDVYADWLPSDTSASDAIEKLRIPYVPYWSFGEPLAAIEEGTSDPSSLGHAYELLARLMAERLDWEKAFTGQNLPIAEPRPRKFLEGPWIQRQRADALRSLTQSGTTGYVEVRHGCRPWIGEYSQLELLAAAKGAVVELIARRPLGAVFENNAEYKPKPLSDGVFARIARADSFDFWALHANGNFIAISSYSEDRGAIEKLFFNTRIFRAAEAVTHCGRLYKALGADSNSNVEMVITYSGLRSRKLSAPDDMRWDWWEESTSVESEVSAQVSFRLTAWESELPHLVKALCAPLFRLFDFKVIPDQTYEQLVADFRAGRVS